MADGIQKSMESLSIQRQQASYPNQSSNSSSAGQSPPPLRPTMNYSDANDTQSASARFERFFNTPTFGSTGSPVMNDKSTLASPHQTPASFGPASSAAGLATSGAFGSFGHSFGARGASGALNQGASTNNTVPALRTKSSNVRQGLPMQWNTGGNDDTNFGGSSPSGGVPTQFQNLGSGSSTVGQAPNSGLSNATTPLADDDIIPTAIVVKNIPFSVKREQLLQIIEDLQIPMPYAFNYHFDQGVFRGLAFANFRSGEEADAVVAALNGFDVSGRKLRVEYKKVLQAGEKERIEKEKAIKRMQSMQMEKERERMRRQTVSGAGDEWNSILAGNFSSLPARPVDAEAGFSDFASGDPNMVGQAQSSIHAPPEGQNEELHSAASDAGARKEELDLNDPATLEIYSRVLLFKDDRMRDELSFSKNLTTSERRIVHMVSKKLGLYHYSLGDGDERHVVVTKNEVEKNLKSVRSPSSTVGRSGRGDGNMPTSGTDYLMPGSSHTTGRTGLRTKKSAPDMKRGRERADDGGFGGLSSHFVFGNGSNTIGSQGSGANNNNNNMYGSTGGMSRKSNGNLREGYSATMGRRPHSGGVGGAAGLQSLFSSPFDVPPVPSLPSNPPDSLAYSPAPSPVGGANSNGGSLSAATSQHILRQPAGPGNSNRNFAHRSRVPLHSGMSPGIPSQQQPMYPGGGDMNNYNHASNGYELDDRFGTLGVLTDDDVRTHEPLEV